MDTTLSSLLASLLPTVAVAVVGGLIKSWFFEIRNGLKEVSEKVGGHAEKLAEHKVRLDSIEARVAALEHSTERRRHAP